MDRLKTTTTNDNDKSKKLLKRLLWRRKRKENEVVEKSEKMLWKTDIFMVEVYANKMGVSNTPRREERKKHEIIGWKQSYMFVVDF